MYLDRKQVYSGRIVDLIVDKIEVKGKEAIREVVRHPGGVVVLVEEQDGLIPFVRQSRYPMSKSLLELPAGKLDPGESPRDTALRELEEETGLKATLLEHVSSFYTSPGFCDELLHLYYTNTVEKTESRPDHDEELTLEKYTLAQSLDLVGRGEIEDAKTILALYWLHWKKSQAKEKQ